LGNPFPRRCAFSLQSLDVYIPLVVLGLTFCGGAFCGLLFAALGNEHTELYNYLIEYFTLVDSGKVRSPSTLSIIWSLVRWPLLAALLGAVRIGVLGLPLLVFVRSFLLSYAICIFKHLFGDDGHLLALVVFGVIAVFTVPVLLIVAHSGLQRTLLLLQGKSGASYLSAEWLSIFLLSSGILTIAAVIQRCAMPALLSMICSGIFT